MMRLLFAFTMILTFSKLEALRFHLKATKSFITKFSIVTKSGRYSASSLKAVDIDWPVEKVRNSFVEYFVAKQKHINYKYFIFFVSKFPTKIPFLDLHLVYQ